MKCPKCQLEISEDSKFCKECGYDLRKTADIPTKQFTHPKSYTPKFLVDKILADKSVIEGERKQVTVFFADVAGFTSFSEKLDPEQVHRSINLLNQRGITVVTGALVEEPEILVKSYLSNALDSEQNLCYGGGHDSCGHIS